MADSHGLFGEKAPQKPRAPKTEAQKPALQASTKAERQEFFLPVSGFVWFYPEEMAVIDHPAFQRLGLINQLGQSYYVYRGATHKRLEHVLGVVGIVQQMISAMKNTSKKGEFRKDSSFAPKLSIAEERFVRLGALLHDIGHLAAGHTIEDELEFVGKHDADKRISLIFDRENWGGVTVATLGSIIDDKYQNYVPEDLKKELKPQDLVRLLIRKPVQGDDGFQKQDEALARSSEIRYCLCRNMIGNTICADLLDYIYRDWYHVGKTRSKDDRIFQYMEIRRQENGRIPPP